MQPISRLYLDILRLHRRLPSVQLKIIGDGYVKNEFRLHWKSNDPRIRERFYSEWQNYRKLLEGQLGGNDTIGQDLDMAAISKEQQLDLDRLKKEIN